VEANIKAEQRRGPSFGSSTARILIFGAVVAATYFLGTSLFSSVHSSQVVRWVLNAVRHGAADDQVLVFNNWLRWSAHYLQFLVLFLVLAVWPLRIRPLPAMILCLLLAAADEGHQYFIPDRTCSLFDFGLDSAGVITAFVLVVSVRRLRGRSRADTAIAVAPGEEASA
jgi:VanZ family protein